MDHSDLRSLLKAGHSLIIPGQVFHIRMFPSRHTFRYPYLMVCISVRDSENRREGILVVDKKTSRMPSFLHIHSGDYLFRAANPMTLSEKVDEFLRHNVWL